MWIKKPPELVAAVDLGSNSFHMIVAKLGNGQLSIVDRLREMVRLAAGLDESSFLSEEAQQRALACLERFGQRLRDMPPHSVRAVGTNTLRRARNADEFLVRAERALGHPIDIVSGIEEARLIYLGVAHSLASDGKRRLVIDIGGGSTEFIIGTGTTPLRKESLQIGCVSMSHRYFGDGKITNKRFKKAVINAQQELEPFETIFQKSCWEEAVGASGTLRAIDKVLRATGWSKEGITLEGLTRLADAIIEAGQIDKIRLPDLSPERYPIFPGGLAIIYASFIILGIGQMKVSEGALREGLLYDLLGRLYHEDSRSHSVKTLAHRYHVDLDHAERIIETVKACLDQIHPIEPFDKDTAIQWLEWAAQLHEIGLDIAHHQYHKHSAYIIEHADLAGFSQQDQKLLATLVRAHRRKFPLKLFNELAHPWKAAALPLAIILRLAVLLHRGRHAEPLPHFEFCIEENRIALKFPIGWLENHPLTQADLEQEAAYLEATGFNLTFA